MPQVRGFEVLEDLNEQRWEECLRGSQLEQSSQNFDSASFTQSQRAALTSSFVQPLPFLLPAFHDGLGAARK